MDTAERGFQIGDKIREVPRDRHMGTPHKDIIPARASQLWQHLGRSFPQPALGAIARDCIAELARARIADTDAVACRFGLGIATPTRLEQQPRRCPSPCTRASQKIATLFQRHDRQSRFSVGQTSQADRRFRPWARRRLITLRPFLVAIRARKPWRALRTRTEGWNVLFMASSPGHTARPSAKARTLGAWANFTGSAAHILLCRCRQSRRACKRLPKRSEERRVVE